ncbi:hypothetical protein DRE_07346 [Drechslerella stenobrocha 248]|uniref:Phosphatidate phosphatase APP1 catalytic domain-containing protein n=1 Tax=Drechslerella stenobrocha 248 TaxID=1043628 RepID=W7HIP9_9PEZI|nr:hypothetical protein DRE_07346 [Drechslerella stenobrocha 248]
MPTVSVHAPGAGEDSWKDLWNRLTSNAGLGFLNWPTNIDADDLIWLHATTAFRRDDRWWAEFNASFFHHASGQHKANVVAEVASAIGLTDDDKETRDLVAKRVELFLRKTIVGRKLNVQIQHGGVVPLPPSGSSGISAKELPIPFTSTPPEPSSIVKLSALLPPGFKTGPIETDMKLVEPEGWAVISDIDDTVKVTHTLSFKDLLLHTFAEPPCPTPGFPDFYKHLDQVLDQPAWFYISASPYNLYPFLLAFLRTFYPYGEPILRDMSWMSVAGLAASVSTGTREYKTMEMRRLVGQWLPQRRYICIGDSTQTDPEAYAEIFKAFPGAIKAIWIRVVTGVSPAEEAKKNSADRFEKAFDGIPKEIWKTFHDVAELAGLAEGLKL